MKIEEIKKAVGKMIYSYDAGHKLISHVSTPHGPYLLKRVTKGGMAVIQRWEDEELEVAPSLIILNK